MREDHSFQLLEHGALFRPNMPYNAWAFTTFLFGGRGMRSTGRKTEEVFSRERVAIAKRMLWYPVAYLTCIFPIAIIRLVGLHEANVSEAIWIFGMFFLFSLGAIDSIIYATTRKLIKPINLPTHMRHLSNSQDSGSNGPLSRNTSVYKPNSHSPSHEKTSFKLTNGSDEDILTTKVDCNVSQRTENRLSGICVTLETIKEVS
ncbi:hypothetical protein Clacol_007204 [Clathrus columnatus]|uniref:Uncharacterized protein n=1 Tax=Clathrus columnatus TaxID=1419009 RepID=A0AAV5AH41_9AGAM|nr:hypothetical protein Clacol_007204 [Clathrus columnatus]